MFGNVHPLGGHVQTTTLNIGCLLCYNYLISVQCIYALSPPVRIKCVVCTQIRKEFLGHKVQLWSRESLDHLLY